jgi:hypothetical protein
MNGSIELTWPEVVMAATQGIFRQISAIKNKRADKYMDDSPGWQTHIEGACGELAVAKFFDLFWSGNYGRLRADDVGPLQVRTTAHATGRLIIYRADADEKIFVLVTGRAPNFCLRGWIRAREGKRAEWLDDPLKQFTNAPERRAYYVPIAALHPMSELHP